MIIDPRLKTLDPGPRGKVGLQRSVDTSLDFNMLLFLISFFFYAGDVLSIYIMTFNTCLVLPTKK